MHEREEIPETMEHFNGVKRLFIATMISFFLPYARGGGALNCWLIVDNKLNLLNARSDLKEFFQLFS